MNLIKIKNLASSKKCAAWHTRVLINIRSWSLQLHPRLGFICPIHDTSEGISKQEDVRDELEEPFVSPYTTFNQHMECFLNFRRSFGLLEIGAIPHSFVGRNIHKNVLRLLGSLCLQLQPLVHLIHPQCNLMHLKRSVIVDEAKFVSRKKWRGAEGLSPQGE